MTKHDHHHEHSHHATGNIKVAFWLNLCFTIIEIVGGILTNSVAIISDALHDLGDSIALGLAWYFQKVSQRGRDKKFSYGYGRFSILAAMINSALLLAGSIYVISIAIPRIITPEETNATGMIWLAVLGLVVNGAAAYRLSHGHSLNEKAVRLHLLEDVLGWAAVLVGAIVIKFTGWTVLDPILSIGIAVWVLINVYKNLRSGLKIFLQGVPENQAINVIQDLLAAQPNVIEVHDIHLWSMDGEYKILTLHVVVPQNINLEEHITLKQNLKNLLIANGYNHVTLEMEKQGEACCQQTC